MPRDDDDFENRPHDGDEDRPRRPRRQREDDDDDFDDYDRPRRGQRLPRELLRGIARDQRIIIFCILVYLCIVAAQFVINPEYRIFLGLAYIPFGLLATVFVFLLATKVYTTGTGIILAILTLIPCIELIALLIINAKATNILKDHGIPVGLLGANGSDI